MGWGINYSDMTEPAVPVTSHCSKLTGKSAWAGEMHFGARLGVADKEARFMRMCGCGWHWRQEL